MQYEPSHVQIERRLGASVILGMGLTREMLRLEDDRLSYEGIEYHRIVWRLVRVRKTVHLKDIETLTTSFAVHPIFVFLALICAVNIVANLLDWNWWFNLSIWRLPYFGFPEVVGRMINQAAPNVTWPLVHFAAFVGYIIIIWLLTRQYLVFSVNGHPTIRFRMDGVAGNQLATFQSTFSAAWHQIKRTPG